MHISIIFSHNVSSQKNNLNGITVFQIEIINFNKTAV